MGDLLELDETDDSNLAIADIRAGGRSLKTE
jgi:hypothetical protein